MSGDPNVSLEQAANYRDIFKLDRKIRKITWLDNGEKVAFEQKCGKDRGVG